MHQGTLLAALEAAQRMRIDLLPAINSPGFLTELIADFSAWTNSNYLDNTDTPFGFLGPQISAQDPAGEVTAWERILELLQTHMAVAYLAMHKGEPFYWLAIASYTTRVKRAGAGVRG